MKNYLLFAIILLFNLISCSQSLVTSSESLSLFALLNYRQNVTIGGTFFGNYNADVRTVALSTDGKCDTTASGLGSGVSDATGGFKVSYPRVSPSGGYVCVIATPKADGTSRFYAVDQQKEFAWTGTAYSILVLPEPSTATRSQFNVVSTMFNRMATQKLEKLADGNKDITRAGTLLKSANKQIVSQFGLSRGLSKNVNSSNLTMNEVFNRILYSEPRASSIESATPDLNDIVIDFTKKDDPVTLKFTVIIGGIQSLADPNDPGSYDKVVGLISNVIASGNSTSSVVFPGGATLSAGGSFGALVSSKVQTFVQSQGAALGLSQTEINNIKVEAAQIATTIDKPPVSATPVTIPVVEKPLYSLTTNVYKAGESIAINPQIIGGTSFQVTEVCTTTCQAVGTSGVNTSFIQISSATGAITGTVPADLPGDITFQLRITASRYSASTTGTVNISLRGKPVLTYSGGNVLPLNVSNLPALYTVGPLAVNGVFLATPIIVGANTTLSATGIPTECVNFNTTSGVISGNFSCVTSETTAKVTVTNDVGSNVYSVKFIPNSKPTVTGLSISGILLFQNTLTANYTYNDSNNNPEVGSSITWLRCASALGTCDAIPNAVNKTYTVQVDDVGKYLKFQVTPKDSLGLAGDSATLTAVQIANRAPSITSVSISNPGAIKVGDVLSATISGYTDPDNTALKYYSYNWFSCSAETTCSTTASGTSTTYTVSETDSGKFVKLQINPVDALDAMGTALYSTVHITETTPPVISDPLIYISAQSATSVSLKWNSATDNVTPANQLKYKLFYSSTASEVQQITTTSSSFPNLQTAIVGSLANPIQLTGLTSETVYYFRVMVEDNDGNRTLYSTRSVLLSNNLMAYLPFDGDIANKSSVALTTTAYGSPVSTTGLYGNAYSFNGASSIAISNNASIKPTTELTLSLWVNANWFTNCRTSDIDGMISSTQSGGYSIGCKGELVEFYVFVGGYKSVGFNKKNLTGWNKLTGTYDGSNLKIYLNGVIQSTLPLSGSISYNNNNSIQIGAEASDGTNPDYSLAFTGSIDEILIYNKALTEQEIKADVTLVTITNPKSNSVGSTLQGNYLTLNQGNPQYNWLRCDNSAGSTCITIPGATTNSYTLTTADTSKFIQFQVTPTGETPIKSQLVQVFNPSQNLVLYMPLDGTIAEKSDLNNPLITSIVGSGVVPSTDRRGQTNGAYSFNGNGYIAVQNNQKIQLSNNLTISAWVKANQFKSLMGIVSKYISPFSSGYILRFWNSQFDNSEMRSPNIYNPNTWYHVVATISSGNVKKLYVDGTFVGSGTEGIVVQASSDPIHIGNDYSDGTSRYMNGSIDEIRIYNKELTATEVLGLYNYEK